MRLSATAPAAPGREADLADLADPRLYAEGDPHRIWRHLRDVAPLHRHTTADGREYWSVTRHADVDRVLRDPATYTSARGTFLNVLGRPDPAAGRQLATTDPPRHTAMRRPLHHTLSTRSTAGQEAVIRTLVRAALAPGLAAGSIDVADAMLGLPFAVLGSMMGIPDRDQPQVARLALMAVAPDEWPLPQGPAVTLTRAHRGLFAYFQDLAREREDRPGTDMMSALLSMRADDELGPGAVVSNCYSLMVGAATWPHAPAAALVEMAARGRYREWSRRPELLDSLVEESVRWASPANHFLRHTTAETELAGTVLPAGAPVVVWLGSANRDEAVFADPYLFDPARRPNRHLGFGSGPHHCLGAPLARRMIRIVLEELFAGVDDLVPAGPVRHIASNFVAGYRSAPLELRRR